MINARWYNQENNWGDLLNPYLIQKISKDKVRFVKKGPKVICVGSIIHYADDNTIVWGSGFISAQFHLKSRPKVLAVRGPKTRDKLLEDGIECPEVYGDPALLLPRYFSPKIEKKYSIGIIPHYIDKQNPWLNQFKGSKYVKIIDIQAGVEQVPKDILSCNLIFSSSLHGVIAADAYGVRGYWMKMSDQLVGGAFKFEDYFLSVKRPIDPIIVTNNTTIKEIKKQTYKYQIDIDLDKLLDACPFAT